MPTLLDKTKVLEAIRAQPLNNTSKAIFQLSHQWATFIRRVVIATSITRRSIIVDY